MDGALDRRGLFSCKKRGEKYRCRNVCRAGGRKLRDFLFVVSIFFVKEQDRSSVKNEVVGERFRKMKKALRFGFCCLEVGLGYGSQNDLQTELKTPLSLRS